MSRSSKLIVIAGVIIALAASFAIAKPKNRSSQTAWLGVYTQTVDIDIAREFELDSDYGVIVNEVVEDSPADEAGLREDDIIIAINGRKLTDADDLSDFIEAQTPGDEIKLTIIRRGREREISVTIEGRSNRRTSRSNHAWTIPSTPQTPRTPRVPRVDRSPRAPRAPRAPRVFQYGSRSYDSHGYIGVSLIELSDQLADYFGADEGVLISEVNEDSPAEEAGLRAGDVIVKAGKRSIDDSSDLQRVIRRLDAGDVVKLQLLRDKATVNIDVEVGERDDNDWYGFNSSDDFGGLHGLYGLQGLEALESLEGLENLGDIFDHSDLHDLDIHIPDLRGLLYWNDDDDNHSRHSFRFDTDEIKRDLRKEMDELRRELKKLQRELDRGGR